jgi:hypothetical protein
VEDLLTVDSPTTTTFTWNYERSRRQLSRLYEKAKGAQWNAQTDLDWTIPVDPTARVMPDEQIPLYGTPMWERLSEANKAEIRHHTTSWILSQFLHGEQGALLCTSQIVETVPWIDAKYYAATQVMDEARHVEVYSRYLDEKVCMTYPINPHLQTLLNQIVSDSRWDITYLGMQIMVEGVALAAFGFIRQLARDPLLQELTRLVMSDEARHVAFGTLSLGEAYSDLTAAERAEREDFCYEAAVLVRDRFLAREVWENLGMDVDACLDAIEHSEMTALFRRMLFSRIMPNLKKLGLLSEHIRPRWETLGVLDFAEWSDPETEAVLAE